MQERAVDCVVTEAATTRPLWPVRPNGLANYLAGLEPAQRGFLQDAGFTGAAQELTLLPGPDGLAGAVIGLGNDRSPFAFGGLVSRLPEAVPWSLQPGDYDEQGAILGWCLGGYRFGGLKQPAKRGTAQLLVADRSGRGLAEATAIWLVRDLINAPANLLGPAELANAATELAGRYGAIARVTRGAELDKNYPTVAAVGRGSERAPCVAAFDWAGSGAAADAPLVSLCGKGVCFDSGGYDIKPSSGMLRMKKDMGGAATVLGLARLIMSADLPLRLAVRIGCVENSISGAAMRPLDVIRTRKGLSVEVGNTDAEGRLVLCDLLAEASDERPALLIDCATLTGAARVALGPELPALFCNNDDWAATLLHHGNACDDPMWRLPLWPGYDPWLTGQTADLNNVSAKPFAGAIVAALFLQRFVTAGQPWVHLDLYGWSDQTQPGKPEGGEAQAIRGIFAALVARFAQK